MISIINSGTYKLAETKHGIKLLTLNHKTYAWILAPRIGSLLIYSSLPHQEQDVLAEGSFRLYSVVDEPGLSDQLHLEVQVSPDNWQGYVLPNGLPDRLRTRRMIIPTHEIITHNLLVPQPSPAKYARPRKAQGDNHEVAHRL